MSREEEAKEALEHYDALCAYADALTNAVDALYARVANGPEGVKFFDSDIGKLIFAAQRVVTDFRLRGKIE